MEFNGMEHAIPLVETYSYSILLRNAANLQIQYSKTTRPRPNSALTKYAGTNPDRVYRELFSSYGLQKKHLIFPVFVKEDDGSGFMVDSMPGIELTPEERILRKIRDVINAGLKSVILFGIPKKRDMIGSSATDTNGVMQRTVKTIRAEFGSLLTIITDVCLCQYNTTGHCGVVVGSAVNNGSNGKYIFERGRNFKVDNDKTLKILTDIALSHAEAGADIVAPSSMMDGQVFSIKQALSTAGFGRVRILPYSVKHASSLYAPFRSAAFYKINGKRYIDKSSYQVSYANPRQAMREIETDINEGADMVMIKPAMAYLDLVSLIKDKFFFPVAVQNVSGEYAMIKAAAMNGWIDEEEWKVCSISSMKRAGADRIISYFSIDIAKYLS